jgi:hypothetical protein
MAREQEVVGVFVRFSCAASSAGQNLHTTAAIFIRAIGAALTSSAPAVKPLARQQLPSKLQNFLLDGSIAGKVRVIPLRRALTWSEGVLELLEQGDLGYRSFGVTAARAI